MPTQYPYFYKRHGLRTITAFLSPDNHMRIKQLAKDADKSLTRYVSRLLENHINSVWQQRTEDYPRKDKEDR